MASFLLPMTITIVGLGPGGQALLTREAWEVLSGASEVFLRTGRHPVVSGLPAGLSIHTFDSLYEESDDFATVYGLITQRVLELARRPEGVVYGVPGHPLVGEATVTALLERAAAEHLRVEVVEGLSFVGPVLTALGVDALAGMQIADALEVGACLHPPLNPDVPAIIGQLYDRGLAGEVKLTLMNQYPDTHPVQLVHAAGTQQREVESLALHALDHSRRIGHLTALYVPALPMTSGFERFQETIAHLRGPAGCPWDRQQTHQSLAQGLMEETAEVLDAIDAGDVRALCEELGDLLLHVVMQTQIASESGDFTAADVIAGIEAKIRRRHPHVFGGECVSDAEQVVTTWKAIKEDERGPDAPVRSALDGVPAALPALAQADAYSRRAAREGFDWPAGYDVVDGVREGMVELLGAGTHEERVREVGDLLFAVANWARRLGVDAETSLRLAVRRFRERFQALEQAAVARAGSIAELDSGEVSELWRRTGGGVLIEGG